MRYDTYSHRRGTDILKTPDCAQQGAEIFRILDDITDDAILRAHNESFSRQKSLSKALNELLKRKFVAHGWEKESAIFQDVEYSAKSDKVWRLDFAKGAVSIEVSYNHGEALAWNLLKPVLASELNHVKKAIQTTMGVIILVTEEMKIAGGFDSAVGTYEKAIRYLGPMQNQLSAPLVLVGLKAPETFKVEHVDGGARSKKARILQL